MRKREGTRVSYILETAGNVFPTTDETEKASRACSTGKPTTTTDNAVSYKLFSRLAGISWCCEFLNELYVTPHLLTENYSALLETVPSLSNDDNRNLQQNDKCVTGFNAVHKLQRTFPERCGKLQIARLVRK